ncbi:MAG: 3-hydroxyacyl-CoA dehydrogenase NAD-binding domain-containing protein [Microscillaceae bacterium]|nr:3-hydroxyacyl-CoA dehydrogenase NAD-binding domain-containing protein [Microscillaceae bacterium]MDW8461132.1 3-hydroxyacyl-CoA dehydrogenase NAD-binding domain-containing protein [Cytophagales bacterium]
MIKYSVNNSVAFVSWNMESEPMNVINQASTKAFAEAMETAIADTNVKGIIITSEKDSFIVGADLKMIRKMFNQKRDVETVFNEAKALNLLFRKFETCGKPIVACINGHALGGGFEICLMAHYRIALNNPKTKIGLPEAKIGLLPGAGGTQRLPRLIGIEKSAPLLLEGKELNPAEALKMGLIHELAETKEEMFEKATKWILANPKYIQPWDERNSKGMIVGKSNYNIPGGNIQSPQGAMLMLPGTAMMYNKTYGNYPAQIAIMRCVYEGLQVPIEKALMIESRYFTQLLMSKEAKNMVRTLFFSIGEANKGAARPKHIPEAKIQKIGILGAGMMGSGIAYVSALAGLEVILKDTTLENAEKSNGIYGKEYSRNLVKTQISKGKMTQEQGEALLNRIKPTADYADLQGCDLVIEAVFENREVKATVTKETEAIIPTTAVFGSNTSTLPITSLAEVSVRPENFIGIHFFSPVDKMPLVEIIIGQKTSDYALAVTIDYVKKIKKTPIVVNDSRGFYTSRCFGTYTAEGMEMLAEGINPILIENAGKMAGMPVGPLAVSDEVSLDLAYKVMKQTEADTGIKIEDIPGGKVVKKFVEELNRIGKKVKKGFYEYPEDGQKYLWEGLKEIYPLKAEQPDIEHLKKRLLHRQALEAVRCLEEGVLRTVEDADVGSILAWGFPAYTGGTLSYIEMIGLEQFVKDCDELADKYGERFRPTEKLREMAKNGELFYKEAEVAEMV